MKARNLNILSAIPEAVLRAWLVRLGILCICLAAIALVLYSFYRRFQPVSRQYEQRTSELLRMADTVEKLQAKANPKDIQEAKDQFANAQKMLWADPEDIRLWEREVRRKARSVIFESQVEMGKSVPYPRVEQKLAYIPVKLAMQPIVVIGLTNSPYQRLLDFQQAIASAPKRLDLIELTVEGASNSVTQAKAAVRLLTEGGNAQ